MDETRRSVNWFEAARIKLLDWHIHTYAYWITIKFHWNANMQLYRNPDAHLNPYYTVECKNLLKCHEETMKGTRLKRKPILMIPNAGIINHYPLWLHTIKSDSAQCVERKLTMSILRILYTSRSVFMITAAVFRCKSNSIWVRLTLLQAWEVCINYF